MGNHEERVFVDSVHMFLAFKRTKDNENGSAKCIRKVIKRYDEDLEILKSQLTILGGEWRIHKTINARDCNKARRLLLHMLIDFPEKSGYIDSLWRTTLLQRECIYGEKKFMLDVDTTDEDLLKQINWRINLNGGKILEEVITPSGGRHIITAPFDTREVCQLPNVTLLRDGYIYVTSVGEKNG